STSTSSSWQSKATASANASSAASGSPSAPDLLPVDGCPAADADGYRLGAAQPGAAVPWRLGVAVVGSHPGDRGDVGDADPRGQVRPTPATMGRTAHRLRLARWGMGHAWQRLLSARRTAAHAQ